MNLLFSPDRLLQSFACATPPPSIEQMRQWLDQEQHGLSRIACNAWQALFSELRAARALNVGVYDGLNALHAKMHWEPKPGPNQAIHISNDEGELHLAPGQLQEIYLACTSHLTRPGLYLYDRQGRLVARICVEEQKDLWTLYAIQTKFAGITQQAGPTSHTNAIPQGDTIKVGVGKQTAKGSRLNQLQSRYCNARVSFLMQAAPHSASQISLHDLAPFFAHLSQRELKLDLIIGGPSAWLHHSIQLSEEIQWEEQLVLQDSSSTLQLSPSSFAEFWLVRSPFKGSFSYSFLAYNSALGLALVALLPKSHLALSVSHWPRFATTFRPCECPDQ